MVGPSNMRSAISCTQNHGKPTTLLASLGSHQGGGTFAPVHAWQLDLRKTYQRSIHTLRPLISPHHSFSSSYSLFFSLSLSVSISISLSLSPSLSLSFSHAHSLSLSLPLFLFFSLSLSRLSLLFMTISRSTSAFLNWPKRFTSSLIPIPISLRKRGPHRMTMRMKRTTTRKILKIMMMR